MESAEMMGGKDATSRAFIEGTPGDGGGWPSGLRLPEMERQVAKRDEEDYKLSAQVNVLSSQQSR